jgi:hypothetical protein
VLFALGAVAAVVTAGGVQGGLDPPARFGLRSGASRTVAPEPPGADSGTTVVPSVPSVPSVPAAPAAPTAAAPSPAARTPIRQPAATAEPTAVPSRGQGRLVPAPGRVPAVGVGRRVRYRLEIESGLPFDPATVARTVHAALVDRRGWGPLEHVAFERTGTATPQIRIILASPVTTDALCAPLDTVGELSCRNGDRMVLNALRWAVGIPAYAGRLDDYRTYMINHEVGHALGHRHAYCTVPGAPAPVMMQQTKGLAQCRPNPWPSITAG